MPVISETVHPQSLDFKNQRLLVLLRDVHKQGWAAIQKKVRNLAGKPPSMSTMYRSYMEFADAKGRRELRYEKSGRNPWKVTKEVEAYIIRRLRYLRRRCVCTSATLQREVARDKGIAIAASTVRKARVGRGDDSGNTLPTK